MASASPRFFLLCNPLGLSVSSSLPVRPRKNQPYGHPEPRSPQSSFWAPPLDAADLQGPPSRYTQRNREVLLSVRGIWSQGTVRASRWGSLGLPQKAHLGFVFGHGRLTFDSIVFPRHVLPLFFHVELYL